jgi:hypothetical protein
MIHIRVSDDEADAAGEVRIAMRVEAPSGKVLQATTGVAAVAGERTWPDLPATIDIPRRDDD